MLYLEAASCSANEAARLVNRVRAEYTESPGLNLTKPQMKRFMSVDERTCTEVLDRLVDARFLERTRLGQYVRVSAAR